MLRSRVKTLLLLFLFASTAAAAPSANIPSVEEIAASPGWRRLLHYKTHWARGQSSAADGEGFFLSPEGYRDPLAELRVTLAALERGGGTYGKLQQPIHCAFPARTEFLEKTLARKFPGGPCGDFAEYMAKLKPRKVSLVFATAYPSNPASMFGHSFLKISAGQGADLLDWSINYAAIVPPDENGFAFAYFGLTGGYQGQFALVPFYAKIEEYGYLEGRDIWEYELWLTPAEIQTLLKAIWEVETNSHFDYYFFDENCSYQLLALLEVVKPDWDISGYFLHFIPGESVKRVALTPGAVGEVKMRPSLERRLRVTVDALAPPERAAFDRARREGPADLRGLSLEAYLLFAQAEKKRKGEEWSQEEGRHLLEALRLRASQNTAAPTLDYGGEKTRPDLSHGAYRVGLGAVAEKGARWGVGAELSVRLAYHDLLDADPGYLAHSEVDFPNLRLRYTRDGFSLHEAELFSLVSLTPWNLLRKPLAWRTRGAYQKFLDVDAKGARVEAGAGAAFSLRPDRWTTWAMVGGQLDGSASFTNTARGGPWLEFGSLVTLSGEAKILFEARGLRVFGAGYDWRADLALGLNQPVGKMWALRLQGEATLPSARDPRFDSRIFAAHYF